MEEYKSDRLVSRINEYKTIIIALIVVILGAIILAVSFFIEVSAGVSELLITIGTVLIPSGFVSLIYEYSLRRTFLIEMRNIMMECMKQQFGFASELQDLGIVKFHRALPTDVIVKGFSNSQNCIKILQTWTPDIVPIEQSFCDAAKRGCSIQILFLNPESPLAKNRAADLGYSDISSVITNINSTIAELVRFCDTNQISNHVKIRLYDSTPTFSLYIFDNTAFLGIFWRRTMAISGFQMEIKGPNSSIWQFIDRQFSYIWKEAEPLDIQTILENKCFETQTLFQVT